MATLAHASVGTDTTKPTGKLTLKYNFWNGYRFYLDNNRISDRESKQLLCQNPLSRPYLKKYKNWWWVNVGTTGASSAEYLYSAIIPPKLVLKIGCSRLLYPLSVLV
jgi:hypothetical protein